MEQKKYTLSTINCLNVALKNARELQHSHFTISHFLYAALNENSILTFGLKKHNFPVDSALKTLELHLESKHKVQVFGSELKILFAEDMINLINQTESNYLDYKMKLPYFSNINTSILFLTLLKNPTPEIKPLLTDILNIDYRDFYNLYCELLLVFKTDNWEEIEQAISENQNTSNTNEEVLSNKEILKKYTTDLTQAAFNKKLDPIIGRTDEINRILQILNRRTKNNPILIGEAGVGKTATVEGLAYAIVNNQNIPHSLRNKRIISLDMGSVLAGAKFRGEFENRMKDIIRVVEEEKNIILFIDEIHTITMGKSQDGGVDAANLLKPALSRGQITCIGATTLDEYRNYIEKDPALERRFQKVLIEEPSKTETIDILTGLRLFYENHHQVKINNSAIEAAVNLSIRYIPDRCLPDKALDLLDESASSLSMLNQALQSTDGTELTITEDNVMQTLSKMTGIPLTTMNKDIQESENANLKLLNMAETLSKSVIGQDEAIKSVSNAIKRSRTGLSDPNKPNGSFLFLGPTGVGKTELCKTLAKFLFNDEHNIIRMDMSEYMDKSSISKLIGTSAGYVGYEDGGYLTEQVKRKPYSVILFDEIEKAHPDIFNILLQVLDEGRLTDGKGNLIDFKNTLIILTSNLGSADLDNNSKESKQEVLNTVRAELKPELLNRIDEIIVFNNLDKENLKDIVKIQLEKVKERLKERDLKLDISSAAIEFILDKGFEESNSHNYGARPIKRSITTYLENELAEVLLAENIPIRLPEPKTVLVMYKDNDEKLSFTITDDLDDL